MKTKIGPHAFRVPAGKKVHLKHWPTLVKPAYDSKKAYEALLHEQLEELILRSQRLPDELLLDEKDVWRGRYESIVDLEEHLHRNGTRIIKIFLYLSKDEQRKRFLARIDDPEKNWKFSLADIAERRFWKHYRKAYEECLRATSTKDAPWYVVPADDKENARLIVSEIILDVLRKLKMTLPTTSVKRRRELLLIRKNLMDEAPGDE